jgi:hypothetical protein
MADKVTGWQDTQLSYAAGLFDGEGCIHIGKSMRKTGVTMYSLRCKITLTYKPVLEQFKSLFGGYLYKDQWHEKSNKHDKLWVWSCNCNTAKEFLIRVLPYLCVKKKEAELGVVFQDKKRKGNHRKSKSEVDLEESQYLLMRALKKEVFI